MKYCFWGTRGSFPVPGRKTIQYGGNTPCIELETKAGTRIILDAGTGIRGLGHKMCLEEYREGKGEAYLLLSHTHWDHIQGFLFFNPAYIEGNKFIIYAGKPHEDRLVNIFAAQTMDAYFPVPLDALRAELIFRELNFCTNFNIKEARISTTQLNHPWISMGYRIEADGKSFVYMTDTAPFKDILLERESSLNLSQDEKPNESALAKLAELEQKAIELARGADILVHDAHMTSGEYDQYLHWGHSSINQAIDFCRQAKAKRLILFHHAPERDDEEMDIILKNAREMVAGEDFQVDAAIEGESGSL